MSLAEAIARSITCWLALAAIAGYAIDGLGFGVHPWAAIAVALVVDRRLAGDPAAAAAADRATPPISSRGSAS